MSVIAEHMRRLLADTRTLLRWGIGLVIAAAIALFLWLGRDSDTGPARQSASGTTPAEDLVPPAEDDGDAAAIPEATGQSSGDIIPPAEP